MGTNAIDVLSEDEKIAIEILEKAGWLLFGDVAVEKATPKGEKWPSYTVGREYRIGLLRAEISSPSGRRPKGRKSK